MKNLTLVDKQILEAYCESGGKVYFISYNPTTVTTNPETAALSSGLIQWYKESSATLVEVIYTISNITQPIFYLTLSQGGFLLQDNGSKLIL